MTRKSPLVGIDYGSKLAGTTAIAWSFDRQEIHFAQSKKGADADAFLLAEIGRLQPAAVHIDAPLSLPGVYRELENFENFFYRQADVELRAMSPLFLGGLSARAMQLKARLAVDKVDCLEVYPAALARELGIKSRGYKKEKASFYALLDVLCQKYNFKLPAEMPFSWHAFDALLALISGLRIEQQCVKVYGNRQEGIIYV